MEGKKMDTIEKFFKKRLMTNPNTKRAYTQGINMFFETIKKDPETYFNNGHDYEADIGDFYMSIEKLPSMTRKNRMNAVKQFLVTNDKTIKDLDLWDTIALKIKGAEPISQETPLDTKDLRNIIQYGDICSKAMFLMMSSSGMRIESLVGLLPSDIHDDETPTRIVLRPEIVKGKKTTITTFMSPEATESYHAWMKVRSRWLESAIKRTTFSYGKKQDDERVFPMSEVNVRDMWRNMLEKSGYGQRDSKTGRSLCHVHMLRKFFRSWMGNVDLAECCMGHKGYLSTYRAYNYKQLGQEYLKHMHNLTIFTNSPDYAKVQDSLNEKDAQIKDLQTQLANIQAMLGIKTQLENMINGKK